MDLFDALLSAGGTITAPPPTPEPETPPPLPGEAASLLEVMLTDSKGRAEIYRVTSLAESGAGTFRDAVENRNLAGGKPITRIVVFDVSGRCVQNRMTTGDMVGTRRRLECTHGNIWIAGQTAPLQSDAATLGAGFTLAGRLNVQGSNTVVDHIRFEASDGTPVWDKSSAKKWQPMQGQAIRIAPPAASSALDVLSRVVIRNCETRWSQDVALVVTGNANGSTGNTAIARGVVIEGCIFSEPLNVSIGQRLAGDTSAQTALYGTGNKDPNKGAVNGHNFGPNFRQGAHAILMLRNLLASCQFRSPQAAQVSSGLQINNVTYNFGIAGGAGPSWLWPFDIDSKPYTTGQIFGFAVNFPKGDPMLRLEWGAAGNWTEGGDRTDFPHATAAHYVRPDAVPDPAGAIRYYDQGNRFVTYYDQAAHPGNAWNDDHITAAYTPAAAPAVDVALAPPDHPLIQLLGVAPYPLPGTVRSAAAAYAFVLGDRTGAGAWPAFRDAHAKRVVEEVRGHRHASRGLPGGDKVVSAGSGAAVLCDDPARDLGHLTAVDLNASVPPAFAIESNGLRAIENWLYIKHVAAGGSASYEAATWLDQI